MQTCSQCGKQNTDDARFCSQCGHPLEVAAETTATISFGGPATRPEGDERATLNDQVRLEPVATDAALLLRQAERAIGSGPLHLVVRPLVADHVAAHPAWIAALQRRTGRPVEMIRDPQSKGAGHAQ